MTGTRTEPDLSLLSVSHLSQDPAHPYSSWPSIPPNPIGRLVLLTPSVTAAASKEIITGKRFSLDQSVYPSGASLYGRLQGEHYVKRVDNGPKTREEAKAKGERYHACFDDFIHINTQGSTQWDYFLHFSYRESGLFYGGLDADDIEAQKTGDIGVAAIARAGGVQTRAILVDLPYFFASNNLPPLDPLSFPSSTTIDLPLLRSALQFFKLEPRVGDVLLVRTGFEHALEEDHARVARGEKSVLNSKFAGVQANEEVVKWIWETGFVAVGSDNPTFEEWRPDFPDMLLHPILLSGQGIMIGELLRLAELAEECKRQDRWSFFFSSCPLMIEHGVASPPSAVAIF